ncbi:MAG: YebC/PmpR family DNA-binding transcriptional regulator [Christensenellaceae bacterium]|jgi:YebC/PmpR family DNA-binding regulatory protein|nr:YebC/PmpR family DNA-binding transcriptional regulator [Christensenellaceae bacterium]
MSGHSKWHNIQLKKGKTDAARGSIFTKLGREIAVAVKTGGADPASNFRLKAVIDKAKINNMPNDNILRSIKKASGADGGADYEEMTYEGYAAGGVAVIVKCLTDNKNRTAADVRHYFDKFGGALGTSGCVSYLFKSKGVIIAEKGKRTLDDALEIALDAGADDILEDDDVFEIYTSPVDVNTVAEALRKAAIKVLSEETELCPDTEIDPQGKTDSVLRLIDALNENDDVQNVYHNAILPEEDEE